MNSAEPPRGWTEEIPGSPHIRHCPCVQFRRAVVSRDRGTPRSERFSSLRSYNVNLIKNFRRTKRAVSTT